MADLSYKATVDVSQAERNLTNLQKSVGGLNDTFVRLKSTLATISLGAIISQSIRFADAIQDLSDATEISTASILGFSRAVQANGGSAEAAQKGLAKLVGSIDEAANKFGESRMAFEDVGVTLEDLRTLSAEDIFKKTVEGLGRIEDVTKRASLSTRLLGKEFRGVNVQGVGQGLNESITASREYASSIKAAADTQQKLETAVNNLQLALLKALKPLADFINSIDPGKIDQFMNSIINLGKAFLALYAIGKIASLMTMLSGAMMSVGAGSMGVAGALSRISVTGAAAATGIGTIVTGIKNLGFVFTTVIPMGGGLNEVLSSLFRNFSRILGGLGRLIPIVGQVYLAFELLNSALELMTGSGIVDWAQRAAKAMGLISATSKENEAAAKKETDAETERLAARAEAAKKQQEDMKRGQEAAAKLAADIAKQAAAYKLVNAAQGRFTQSLFDNLGFQRDTVSLTEDELEVRTRVKEETDRYADAVQSLKDKQASLRAEMIGEKDAEKMKLIGNEIALINGTLKQAESLHKLNKQQIEEQVPVIQGLRMVEAARKQDIENTNKAIEGQMARQQQLADILRGINDKTVDIKFQESQKGKSPFEQQVANIQESARKAALDAGRAYAAAFEDTGDGLTAERASELANGLNAIADAYIYIAQAQIKSLGSSNDMIRGLTEAWDSYKAAALDTASQIKDNFGNFTQSMEDAFVRFAQTGKLSFKDLANSILADLARIAFKKAVVGMASLFGFAAGGQVMADTPIIVGERGPELFVPRSAGAIVPNNALGGMAGRSNEGGGGQTTVNYNISAVDAASFRSLVARDPSFIYAVTEQGRRSQPTRSR